MKQEHVKVTQVQEGSESSSEASDGVHLICACIWHVHAYMRAHIMPYACSVMQCHAMPCATHAALLTEANDGDRPEEEEEPPPTNLPGVYNVEKIVMHRGNWPGSRGVKYVSGLSEGQVTDTNKHPPPDPSFILRVP